MNLKKSKTFLLLLFLVFVLPGAKCVDSVKKKVSSPPAPKPNYVYDTDPRNNEFIKGGLSSGKLPVLDKVLLREKKLGGLKLSNSELNNISKYDQEINDAYSRWRKVKNMMRSSQNVIYPDER